MKKILILFSLTSCVSTNNISKIKSIKQCSKNIQELSSWLYVDYENGDIPRHVAENYLYILQTTQEDLNKLQTKYDK